MDNPSQDPVYVDGTSADCTLQSVGPAADKIQKVDLPPELKSIPLETLSVEDVCYLLDHSQLSAVTVVIRENQFSGILER